MLKEKVAEDIMVDISKYPHIPYWFAIRKAAVIARLYIYECKSQSSPVVLFVFDEMYNLMGTLSLKDLLKWHNKSKKELDRPVSEIMTPVKFYIGPSDGVGKAAELMLQHDLEILPVIDDEKDFVGVVRMVEVFDNLLNGQ